MVNKMEFVTSADMPNCFLIARAYPKHGPCHCFLSESRGYRKTLPNTGGMNERSDKDNEHRYHWVDYHFRTPSFLYNQEVIRLRSLTDIAKTIRDATASGFIKDDDNIVVLYESLAEV